MKRFVLLVCLSVLNYGPVVVLGCSCAAGPVLTDLQEACRDYQWQSEAVFSALVVDRQLDDTKCYLYNFMGDCDEPGYSYVVEVVDVFKGNHQVLYFVCYYGILIGAMWSMFGVAINLLTSASASYHIAVNDHECRDSAVIYGSYFQSKI